MDLPKIFSSGKLQSCSPVVFFKKGVLKDFANHRNFSGVIERDQACDFIKKETPTQNFSCDFCEILKNILFYRTPPVAAS